LLEFKNEILDADHWYQQITRFTQISLSLRRKNDKAGSRHRLWFDLAGEGHAGWCVNGAMPATPRGLAFNC
jgi:hypothetical protein